MKTEPSSISRSSRHRFVASCCALLLLAGSIAAARADHFNAAYLEGADGVWEHDGFWTTSAYPNNGHVIFNSNGDPIPGPNPTYDVLISVPTPCTLGIGVTIQTLNVLNGSTLNLAPNAAITANTGMGVGGLVTLNASASGGSGLRIGQALSGGSSIVSPGVISMSDNGGNFVSGAVDGVTFTINSGGILRGAGQLNVGYFGGNEHLLNFVNHGLIDAFHTNTPLTIGVGEQVGPPAVNARLTNDGVVRASGNGTLRFRAFNNIGNVVNTGGTIAAIDNATVRLAFPVVITGGTLATADNGTIRGDYPGNGGGTFKDVVNVGVLAMAQGETFGFAGTFTNNGLVRLDGNIDGNSTGLLMRDTNVTLAGTGLIAMNNASGIAGGDVVGRTLTINPGATIRGRGQFGTNNSSFGPKALNVVNQGLIDATGPLTMFVVNQQSSNVTNTNGGILRASSGGALHFTGPGSVFNSGGTIEAQTGSAVRVNPTATVEGGVVTSSGTGVIAGGTAGTGGGTLKNVTNTGTIGVVQDEKIGVAGTLLNLGLVRLENGPLILREGDVTLAGSGLFTLVNGIIAGDGYVGRNATFAPGATIRGSGQIGVGNSNFELKSINVLNRGLVEANGGLTVWLINNQNSNANNNGGTFRASGLGSVLAFTGPGRVDNTGGVLEALNGGSMQFNSGATLANLSAGTLSGGTYRVADTGSGATLQLNSPAIATNAATVILSGANAQFPQINSLTQNNGTLVLNDGATRTFAGATGAAARGDATSATFPNAGTIVIGNNSSLGINGDFAQGSNGKLEVVIGSASQPTALNVTGTAALAGRLDVKLANGYTPPAGATFPILNAANVTGGFVQVTGANVTYGPNGISVQPTGQTNALQMTSAVSRKVHGDAGVFDVALPGVESRRTNSEHTLVFTFSNQIVNGSATYGSGTNSSAATRTISGDSVTVNLANVADEQQVTVTLSGITDVYSQVLPDTAVTVKFLRGDVNGDAVVNSGDALTTRNRSGQTASAENFRADVNVDGTINGGDALIVRAASGHALP